MIYRDFLQEFDKSIYLSSQEYQLDTENFEGYIVQLDKYLLAYFQEKRLLYEFEILKNLASEKTYLYS